MKKFTYMDLRNYLLTKAGYEKYRRLAEFIKTEFSSDPNFDLYKYLYENGDRVIFTAKDEKDLIKKRDEFIKEKFRLMNFNLIDEIKAHLKDRSLEYP